MPPIRDGGAASRVSSRRMIRPENRGGEQLRIIFSLDIFKVLILYFLIFTTVEICFVLSGLISTVFSLGYFKGRSGIMYTSCIDSINSVYFVQ